MEADGKRYQAPAVITLDSPQTPHQISVGAPGHQPFSLTLIPEFRYRTLVAPLLAPVDLISGNAWQVPTRQIEVDLARTSWTNEPDGAALLSRDDYSSARRSRRVGIGLVAGGMVANTIGAGLMLSGVCYEECDDTAEHRMTAGAVVMGVATVAVVTGVIMWVRNHRRESRIEDEFLSRGPWTASAR